MHLSQASLPNPFRPGECELCPAPENVQRQLRESLCDASASALSPYEVTVDLMRVMDKDLSLKTAERAIRSLIKKKDQIDEGIDEVDITFAVHCAITGDLGDFLKRVEDTCGWESGNCWSRLVGHRFGNQSAEHSGNVMCRACLVRMLSGLRCSRALFG